MFNDHPLTREAICLNVEPQANGGRKIPLHIIYGCTHDLLTFCNGSDMEMTMQYKLRLY